MRNITEVDLSIIATGLRSTGWRYRNNKERRKLMKKLIGIALVLALAVMLVPSAVFAADPVAVVINWAGGGGLTTGTVTAGSTLATTNFTVLGNNVNGQFNANYTGLGGGPYTGATYTTKMNTSLTDGCIAYQTVRGAFGYTNGNQLEPGGFSTYSFVGAGTWTGQTFATGTGAVSMKMGATTGGPITTNTGVNTELLDNNYALNQGWPTFSATGTSAFSMIQSLAAADGDFATGSAVGNGSATWDCIGSTAQRTYAMVGGPLSGYNFAEFQDFHGTSGSGILTLQGSGNNSVNLTDLTATGGNPATSSFNSTGTLTVVGSGLQVTGTGSAGSATINQNVGWNTATLGAFTYNRAIINSN
jgi:hypothetical protein